MLSHPREWMLIPGERYTPGPVLEISRPPRPGSATRCTGHRPLQNSSPMRCWTWRWNPYGCSTRRPKSRLQARQTAWPALECSATSRPHTRKAWWNSGSHSTASSPRRATGTYTNSSSSLRQPRSGAGRTRTTRTPSAWARRASRSRPCPPSCRRRAPRHCSRAPTKGKQQHGQGGAGPDELRGGGLDGSLQAPCPGHRGN